MSTTVVRRGPRPRHPRHARPRRIRADTGTLRGALWALVVAIDFFLLSNPLVLVPTFDTSLRWALICTAVTVVLSLPWLRPPDLPWTVVAFLGWAGLSVIWSINSDATLSALMLYLLISIMAVVITANATVRVIIQGFAGGAVAVVVASFYALWQSLPGALIPLGGEGYLAGIGSNRNILAYTLVLALPVFLCSMPRRWVSRALWFVGLASLLTGIAASTSGTGDLAVAVLIFVALMLRAFVIIERRLSANAMWLVRSALVLPVIAAVLLFDQVVGLLGRDPETLSGRVPLWSATLRAVEQEPVLGYGWGAVWPHPWAQAPDNPVVEKIYQDAGILLTHGHNSWLDLLPEVGIVGTALVAGIFLAAGWRARTVGHAAPGSVADAVLVWRLVALTLTAHLVFGLTEPLVTIPLGWFVLVVMTQVSAPTDRRESTRPGLGYHDPASTRQDSGQHPPSL